MTNHNTFSVETAALLEAEIQIAYQIRERFNELGSDIKSKEFKLFLKSIGISDAKKADRMLQMLDAFEAVGASPEDFCAGIQYDAAYQLPSISEDLYPFIKTLIEESVADPEDLGKLVTQKKLEEANLMHMITSSDLVPQVVKERVAQKVLGAKEVLKFIEELSQITNEENQAQFTKDVAEIESNRDLKKLIKSVKATNALLQYIEEDSFPPELKEQAPAVLQAQQSGLVTEFYEVVKATIAVRNEAAKLPIKKINLNTTLNKIYDQVGASTPALAESLDIIHDNYNEGPITFELNDQQIVVEITQGKKGEELEPMQPTVRIHDAKISEDTWKAVKQKADEKYAGDPLAVSRFLRDAVEVETVTHEPVAAEPAEIQERDEKIAQLLPLAKAAEALRDENKELKVTIVSLEDAISKLKEIQSEAEKLQKDNVTLRSLIDKAQKSHSPADILATYPKGALDLKTKVS